MAEDSSRSTAADLPPELAQLLEARNAAQADSAWQRFLAAYHKLVLYAIRSTERDRDTVMDCYAHVLEQLRKDDYRRLRAFAAKGRAKFTTWLVVVTQRLALDQRRARYGRERPVANPRVTDPFEARRRPESTAACTASGTLLCVVRPRNLALPASFALTMAFMAGSWNARFSARDDVVVDDIHVVHLQILERDIEYPGELLLGRRGGVQARLAVLRQGDLGAVDERLPRSSLEDLPDHLLIVRLLWSIGGRVEGGDTGVEGRSHQGGRTGAQYAHHDHRDPDAGLPQVR